MSGIGYNGIDELESCGPVKLGIPEVDNWQEMMSDMYRQVADIMKKLESYTPQGLAAQNSQ